MKRKISLPELLQSSLFMLFMLFIYISVNVMNDFSYCCISQIVPELWFFQMEAWRST